MSTATLSTPSTGPTKACSTCGNLLPIAAFRRQSAVSERRDSRCNECHAEEMREGRRRRRERELGRFVAGLSSAKNGSQVAALTHAMLQRFGGLDRLSAEWIAAIEAAREQNPGGRLVLNSMLAIVRLLETASRAAPRMDLSALSDEELDAQLDVCLDRVMNRRCTTTMLPQSPDRKVPDGRVQTSL